MKKIAIFVEGQTELIFVRDLLLKVMPNDKIGIRCIELLSSGVSKSVPWSHNDNDRVDILFQIMDVGGDKKVFAAIKNRGENLINNGFNNILGLRDMYSEEYNILTSRMDKKSAIEEMLLTNKNNIATLKYKKKVKIFFAVMEIESWFLGLYNFFEKINKKLTVDHIKTKFGLDLENIDAEKQCNKPANEVKRILASVGVNYNKDRDICNKIVGNITKEDYIDLAGRGKVDSYGYFYKEIINYIP
ncbi:MAG: hypothetical protein WCV71_01760 [Patescibacteria group bacterium]